MAEFRIHPQLVDDCHRLGRLPSSHLLLHRNSAMPWFILVPETDAVDLLDLERDERIALIDDAANVSRFVKHEMGFPKVNFGAIGNLVPQMHLHVIGRRPGDSCWPAPVWGHLGDAPGYQDSRIDELTRGLAATCRLAPGNASGD